MTESRSTCYAIIGTPRSGSSLLAGIVHNLGINMGSKLMAACDHNEKGFYEDLEFINVHRHLYGTIPNLFDDPIAKNIETVKPAYINLVRQRCTQEKWGVKDPRMVMILEEFSSYLVNCDLKVISTQRPINQSAKSMSKVLNVSYKQGSEIIGRYEVARLDCLSWAKKNNIEHIVVPYTDIMENTKESVSQVAKFCGIEDEGTVFMAGCLVDKSLWHNK